MTTALQHDGFKKVFQSEKLSLGFILPIESYPSSATPSLIDHIELAKFADSKGFAALWARDVPFLDPHFGDAGQTFDPFTYLAFLSAHTENIALATGSAVITLRHPVHLAKQALSVNALSNNRMILGIASGDRATEYPAFGIASDFDTRGERFRDTFEYFKSLTSKSFPVHKSKRFGGIAGELDLLPKTSVEPPIVVTGRSRQDMSWIAQHSDAWLYYFIEKSRLSPLLTTWQNESKKFSQDRNAKPFAQGLFLDLSENANAPARAIHSGMQIGRNALVEYLYDLQSMGVNHFAMNLKLASRPANEIIEELAEFVLPHFSK